MLRSLARMRIAPIRQALRTSNPRSLSAGAVEKEPLDIPQYVLGFVSGVALFAGGRFISANNKGGEDLDPRSQEFRDIAMNQGMFEAFAGGMEWGGVAWATLVAMQVAEHFKSSKPILAMMGAPRVALLIAGSACCGFAIRGEEKLIGAARKKLIDQGNSEFGQK